ncbi:MAG: DUF3343 domain-containing protein [Chloroflexia bacterium]
MTPGSKDATPEWGVLLVPSVSHALRAESLVRQAGIACKLIPTPRQLSSDCGTALRFAWEDRERVRTVVETAGLEYEGVFPLP